MYDVGQQDDVVEAGTPHEDASITPASSENPDARQDAASKEPNTKREPDNSLQRSQSNDVDPHLVYFKVMKDY